MQLARVADHLTRRASRTRHTGRGATARAPRPAGRAPARPRRRPSARTRSPAASPPAYPHPTSRPAASSRRARPPGAAAGDRGPDPAPSSSSADGRWVTGGRGAAHRRIARRRTPTRPRTGPDRRCPGCGCAATAANSPGSSEVRRYGVVSDSGLMILFSRRRSSSAAMPIRSSSSTEVNGKLNTSTKPAVASADVTARRARWLRVRPRPTGARGTTAGSGRIRSADQPLRRSRRGRAGRVASSAR